MNKPALLRISERDFRNQEVILDFHHFDHCTFHGCSLIFHGSGPFSLSNNDLHDCRVLFAGPAAFTVEVLKSLYHGGFQEVVEQTFNDIRQS